MLYKDLAVYYQRLESISRRLEMTDVLIEMISETDPSISDKVIALMKRNGFD